MICRPGKVKSRRLLLNPNHPQSEGSDTQAYNSNQLLQTQRIGHLRDQVHSVTQDCSKNPKKKSNILCNRPVQIFFGQKAQTPQGTLDQKVQCTPILNAIQTHFTTSQELRSWQF